MFFAKTIGSMDSARPSVSGSPADIVFSCIHCAGALVVDVAAAGLSLTCQHCGKPTPVPAAGSAADAKAQLTDLQRKLKENESQRTEVTGHINQLCIQIHRWKLRLQTLNQRKAELETALAAQKN
jgi:transcription elongation factor Elf1